jgi:hypothetical protein
MIEFSREFRLMWPLRYGCCAGLANVLNRRKIRV